MSTCFSVSCLPACFQKLQWDLNPIKKTFPNLFPQVIEAASSKKNLQSYQFADLSESNLDDFFIQLFENTTDQPLNDLTDHILNTLSMSKLDGIIPKDDLEHMESLLKKLADNLPKETKKKDLEENLHSNGTKIITSFLPNFFRVFYRAFELLNLDCPPETLYEYGVLVTLYINFFSIFYHSIIALNVLLGNPWQVLAIVTTGLTSTIGVLYAYLQCLKKCPSQVSYCVNPKEHDSVNLIGCKKKCAEIASHLNKICNVALVGEPGTGKTEFMKSLPVNLPKFKHKVFIFDTTALAGGGTGMLKIADRVNTALRDVADFKSEVVLCMDELGSSLKKDESLETLILKGFKTRFVATMTQEQWDGLSNELKQRFKPIFFQSDDDLTLEILKDRANQAAIQITDNALQKIIEMTNAQQAKYAQPRKAVEAFASLQGKLSEFNIEAYKTPEHKEMLQRKKNLGKNCFELNSPIFSEKETYFGEQEKLKEEIKPLQEASESQKMLARKIRGYLGCLKVYREKHIALIRLFKQKGSLEEAEKKQFLFAQCFAIPKLKQLIQSLEKHQNADVYVHLNEAMVQNYMDVKVP